MTSKAWSKSFPADTHDYCKNAASCRTSCWWTGAWASSMPPPPLSTPLDLTTQPLASIAKKEELIYVRGTEQEPIHLPRHSPVLRLIQRIRDETHRFAVTFHRRRRSGRTLTSVLTQIPGVGDKTAKRLLQRLGSVPQIAAASLDRLSAENLSPSCQEHLRSLSSTGSQRPLVARNLKPRCVGPINSPLGRGARAKGVRGVVCPVLLKRSVPGAVPGPPVPGVESTGALPRQEEYGYSAVRLQVYTSDLNGDTVPVRRCGSRAV